MAGRFFDEWAIGDTVIHGITRTVTETELAHRLAS